MRTNAGVPTSGGSARAAGGSAAAVGAAGDLGKDTTAPGRMGGRGVRQAVAAATGRARTPAGGGWGVIARGERQDVSSSGAKEGLVDGVVCTAAMRPSVAQGLSGGKLGWGQAATATARVSPAPSSPVQIHPDPAAEVVDINARRGAGVECTRKQKTCPDSGKLYYNNGKCSSVWKDTAENSQHTATMTAALADSTSTVGKQTGQSLQGIRAQGRAMQGVAATTTIEVGGAPGVARASTADAVQRSGRTGQRIDGKCAQGSMVGGAVAGRRGAGVRTTAASPSFPRGGVAEGNKHQVRSCT